MPPFILAGRAILFRLLRLVITITVESFIYHKSFRISPKRGIEYAIIIDLFAEIFGAILFTFLQSASPINPSRHLIIYLFLDDFQQVALDVLVLSLFYFLLFLFVKWIGLLFINTFIYESENTSSDGETATSNLEKTTQWGEQFKAIAKAHTISYFVTLLFALFTIRVFYL
ncbi:filament integrity protein FraC [Capilliphycus salinus ALCB114379]|uniref:filament integrity protein FraC n=1 Tax=Capilliphycus salinus TaxID=2768948 RepID=UPI0039A548BA